MTQGMCMHILQYSSPHSILLYHIRDEESSETEITSSTSLSS